MSLNNCTHPQPFLDLSLWLTTSSMNIRNMILKHWISPKKTTGMVSLIELSALPHLSLWLASSSTTLQSAVRQTSSHSLVNQDTHPVLALPKPFEALERELWQSSSRGTAHNSHQLSHGQLWPRKWTWEKISLTGTQDTGLTNSQWLCPFEICHPHFQRKPKPICLNAVGSKNCNENFRQARIYNFRVKCVVFARNRKFAKLTQLNMQYIPCNSALLAQETLFLTQKGTFLAQRSPKSA